MQFYKYTFIFALMFFSIRAYSQFTISGEFRPRAEYRNGYKDLFFKGQDNAFFIDQRTRLNLDFKNEKYAAKLVFQDVRVWGSTPQLVVGDGALTSIHEAWAQVFLKDFSIKFGRQEIIYDDHRIFGSVGWAQQARSHDALIFKYSKDDLKIDLGLAFNQDAARLSSTFTVNASYKAFQYLWLNKKFGDFTGSLLFLNNGNQGGIFTDFKTYYSQTIGPRISYKKDALSANLVYYYQGGRQPIVAVVGNTKINASLIGLDVGYALNEKISATLGFERQSGNSEVSPGTKNEAFTPFYGTNHKFNGFMDYFYVGNHIGSVGLQDIFLSFNFKPSKVTIRGDFHLFSSAEDVDDPLIPGTAMDKALGTELDLVFGYPLVDGANLNLGYSQMFATSTMEALKGGDKGETQNWGWLMITLKPQFFTTKEN